MELVCPNCHRPLLFSGDPPSFCGYCREPLPIACASSVSKAVSAAPPANSPDKIGDYRLGVRLGAGGMGTVYEATHTTTGRRVAVKLLSQRLSGDPQQLERFRQEGRLASQINHPRCVFVYAADQDRGQPYIVMELMPGTTLEDQVKGQGRPLPIRDAIDRTLEIIDGLAAAHRLGVLHRDVKPSNCFLLDDGTVKIGDFGLSKILAFDAEFSEPGAYKGTVMFSPLEQLRNEPLDLRADVYSVTATLYFLLTGQAPFEGESWVTAVARAASEPAPDVRRLRPEVPGALARIIHKGLHPDRARRPANLEELRQALISQVPVRLDAAGFGLRIGAWLIDEAALSFRFFLPWDDLIESALLPRGVAFGAWMTISLVYFTITEGYGGASLGKRALHLRVCRSGEFEVPGAKRAALRAFLLSLAFIVPRLGVMALPATYPRDVIQLFATLSGLLILAWPMRPRNGFRAFHELLSETRVVTLPWAEPPLTYPAIIPVPRLEPAGKNLPDTLGPFRITGVSAHNESRAILKAKDEELGRNVLIVLHGETGHVEPWRRELSRPARPRWLTGGTWQQLAWDAFLDPGGYPVSSLVSTREPMPWAKARPVLEQLARELIDAQHDGSLPSPLTLDQVHVREDGRLQLLDWPLCNEPGIQRTPLELVQRVTVLLLEGKSPSEGEMRAPRAPVPVHASPMLERLAGIRDQSPSLEAFVSQLDATRDRPRSVGVSQKIAYLSVLAVLHSVGLLLMFAPTFLLQWISQKDQTNVTQIVGRFWDVQQAGPQKQLVIVGTALSMPVIFWPLAWVVWAFCFRGGFTHGLTGLRLVRQDGQAASRLQCAFRVLVVWTPVTMLLLAANLLRSQVSAWHDLADTVMWSAVGLLGVYAYFSLLYPSRSLHDWLAGTWLVPE